MTIRRRDRRQVKIERDLWREKARLRAEELVLLRADNDRLREALQAARTSQVGHPHWCPWWADHQFCECIAGKIDRALSADADADAEPPPAFSDHYVAPHERVGAESSHTEADEHNYLSTACFHGLHERCRLRCKFCYAECGCACGHQDLQMDQAVLDRHGQWWQPIEEPPGTKTKGKG